MQFDTAFLPEEDVLIVRVHGTGDAETVPQLVAAIRSAPEFKPGMAVLIDALGTDFAPSAQDATALPAFFEKELPGSRLAVLVRATRQYAIASLVQTLASRRDVPLFAVFPNREEALEWLTAKS
jgi:hypothetical protein